MVNQREAKNIRSVLLTHQKRCVLVGLKYIFVARKVGYTFDINDESWAGILNLQILTPTFPLLVSHFVHVNNVFESESLQAHLHCSYKWIT